MYEFEHPFSYNGQSGIAEARWNSNSERYELRAINITTPEALRVTMLSDADLKASVDDLTKHIIADIRKANPCGWQRASIAAYDERHSKKPAPFDPVREYGTYDVRTL